jgi:DeoR family glycerol-3-phosphate regulon repressor
MKTPTPRQQELLTQVRHEGFASVKALAKHFGVTHQTIRRETRLAMCG